MEQIADSRSNTSSVKLRPNKHDNALLSRSASDLLIHWIVPTCAALAYRGVAHRADELVVRRRPRFFGGLHLSGRPPPGSSHHDPHYVALAVARLGSRLCICVPRLRAVRAATVAHRSLH